MSVNDESIRPVPGTIRVVIADDYPLLRQGMRVALDAEWDLQAIGECDVAFAVHVVRELAPDVLLLGLPTPPRRGLEAARELAGSNVKVVIFAADMSREATIAALRYGVRGVLLKNAPSAQVMKCLRCVGRGEHWVSHELVSNLVTAVSQAIDPSSLAGQCVRCRAEMRQSAPASVAPLRCYPSSVPPGEPPTPASPFRLTDREGQVLALIVAGNPNKDIAAQLGLQVHTVKRHLTNIFDKTGASSRLELAMMAVHHRIV